jgi:hypothetical protein
MFSGAGDGIRTRDIQLGKLTLYQLSYTRSYSANIDAPEMQVKDEMVPESLSRVRRLSISGGRRHNCAHSDGSGAGSRNSERCGWSAFRLHIDVKRNSLFPVAFVSYKAVHNAYLL